MIRLTKLCTDVIRSSDCLVVEKSLHCVVGAIGGAGEVLNKECRVHRGHDLWDVKDALTGHDIDLDVVRVARGAWLLPLTGTVKFVHFFAVAEAMKLVPRSS